MIVTTLALVVFCSSIVAFFSQEFSKMFKKIFAIPGVLLLAPLALASWLIEIYEDWGAWLLLWIQAGLHQFLHKLSVLVPFESHSLSFFRIVYLFLIASLPVWISRLMALRKGYRAPQTSTYWVGLILWIIAAILLTVA